MSNVYIGVSDNNKKEKPLESLREPQLARGLLPGEIGWFQANYEKVPLCDCEVKTSSEGTTYRCALYGPLPATEFAVTCLRCQKEISDRLLEEERLYRKALRGSPRV